MIQVSEPSIGLLEGAAVQLTLARNQLSMGREVAIFEQRFGDYLGLPNGLTCSSGTTALHLALLALGVGPGDEVIVPNLTYVASANAVRYCGATVRLADVRNDDWTLDYGSALQVLTPRTKAIVLVDLYGNLPRDAKAFMNLAKQRNLFLVEDAAQAIGGSIRFGDDPEMRVGHIGDAATFSFFGNKIMTAGEGGFATFRDRQHYDIAKKLRGQGQSHRRYHFDVVGFNYRMTEIQAAILGAQLERIEELLSRRRQIFSIYEGFLKDLPFILPRADSPRTAPWLKTIRICSEVSKPIGVIADDMRRLGVDTRPVFEPLSQMGVYDERGAFNESHSAWLRGISLPTHPNMSHDDAYRVVKALEEACQ